MITLLVALTVLSALEWRDRISFLRWTKAHWPNQGALLIWATFALTVATFALTVVTLAALSQQRRDRSTFTVPSERRANDQAEMRRMVRTRITKDLNYSLAREAETILGLQPGALQLSGLVIQCQDQTSAALRDETTIFHAFGQGGGLLISGAPGTGKTTQLLQLAM